METKDRLEDGKQGVKRERKERERERERERKR